MQTLEGGERSEVRATELVAIDLIDVRPGRRPLDMAVVDAMAVSMKEIGLKQPVSILYHAERPDNLPPRDDLTEAFVLVAGGHRLAAAKKLGWLQIEAFVSDTGNALDAELWEIDENLARAELSPTQRAEQIARRKAIYLELHPETRQGTPGVSRQVGDTRERAEVERFTADTAALTGRSERSIQRDAERGERVIPEARAMLQGTPLDTGTYLDKIKKLTPNDQVTAIRRDLAALKEGAGRAQTGARDADSLPPPDAELFNRFLFLADEMAALPVAAVVNGSGRQRAALGQRASGLIDHLSAIVEVIDQ